MYKNKGIDFTGQDFFLGIDVHARQWNVTIRHNNMELKTCSMDPSPSVLTRYMERHYPGGNYHSVYEAGFCGFWPHRELTKLGFENIVVHPPDVPTSHKEKDRKDDPVDSRKLSRELEKGDLTAIYVPDEFHQQLKSLVRLRGRITESTTRVKNRIKGYLYYNGIPIPPHSELSHWSNNFISWLEELEFSSQPGKEYLRICLDELRSHRRRLASVTRSLRKYARETGISETIKLLCSVPGIGFVTAISFYAELMDMGRFPNLDHLASYIGLVPSIYSSDTREKNRGLTKRRNRYLRYLIIEAAWVAVRKDPVLLYKFNELSRRMKKQDAIIRIAKKLLSRIRYVWRTGMPYCPSVIE